MIQYFLALIEGMALVASPCILPVLPIVLAGGIDGGVRRPLGIVAGFISSFTIFAILSRQAVLAAHIDGDVIRHVSLALLIILGLVMVSEKISGIITSKMEGIARAGQNLSSTLNAKTGFWSGFGIGCLIGLVWTPCAGPVMAAAVIQIIQAKDPASAAVTVFMFALGAAVPMLLIALFGRRVIDRAPALKKHARGIRQALGILIIVMAAAIWTGLDQKFFAASMPTEETTIDDGRLHDALAKPYAAPDFAQITAWLNSKPLSMKDLKGKVVLVDFWTYSCINCVRTLPYITRWDEKYRDKGLVIVGVHSPEFTFEKNKDNVIAAIKAHGIRYPVAMDNDFATFRAFDNQYWPAHYLIDQEGHVVYTHFGEGNYAVTENNIRALLKIKGDAKVEEKKAFAEQQSPETYLGLERRDRFDGLNAKEIAADHWTLSGDWQENAESITSTGAGAIRFHFQGGRVFLVMGPADKQPQDVEIFVDGKKTKDLRIGHETLYELVRLPNPGSGVVEIRVKAAGLKAYAFTFGA